MSGVSSNTSSKFPARGPAVAWGPVAALVVSVLTLIGAQLLAGIILFFAYTGDARQLWMTSTAGQFYFVLISDVLIFSTVWAFLRIRKAKLGDIGMGRQPVWRDLGMALLMYVVYLGAFIMVSVLASMLTQINLEQKQELGFEYLFSRADRVMALLSLVILPPIIEETLFRGFLFTGLRKKFNFAWAAAITSVMFAGLHLLGSSDGLLWVAALDTFVLSVALCYLREKTGALWASMALHAVKNTVAFMFLLASVAVL